jgi:hypothetical protein
MRFGWWQECRLVHSVCGGQKLIDPGTVIEEGLLVFVAQDRRENLNESMTLQWHAYSRKATGKDRGHHVNEVIVGGAHFQISIGSPSFLIASATSHDHWKSW